MWCHFRENDMIIREILDRFISSPKQKSRFSQANISFLEIEASSHSVIPINTEPNFRRMKRKFNFDKSWRNKKKVKSTMIRFQYSDERVSAIQSLL